jgi:protease-4
MKRLAASGGYYLAMGIGTEGRIFAEPTTWTGSIGVIIPRYNAAELASKIGVTVEPLVTGPLKSSLNPFRDLSDQEQEVWAAILKDSFDRFVGVIEQNRSTLDDEQVRQLATGQIYTTSQAIEHGLVDEVGYEEEALEALAQSLGLSEYEVIEYSSTPTLLDVILSGTVQAKPGFKEELRSATVPKAMYYCSWNPWVPGYGE